MSTSIAKVTEITAQSTKGFEDAIESGIGRACKTLNNVTGAWVNEMTLDVQDGKISAYRVNMKVTFVLDD
ncbi:MAG: dodecin family protein [Phycisphaerales bacterium]